MNIAKTAAVALALAALAGPSGLPSARAADGDLVIPPNSQGLGVTQYTAAQVAVWKTKTIDGKPFRVSPAISHGPRVELNHERITVNYTGAGSVYLSATSYPANDIDAALKYKRRALPVKSGVETPVTTPYKGRYYTWIILSADGTARITSITHTCWRGANTLFGHEAGSFKFASGTLPFRLMYPRNYDPKTSYPLVLSVSGSGGVGNDNAKSMEMVILARYLFIRYYHEPEFACFSLVPQIPSLTDVPAPYYPKGRKGAPTVHHPDWPAANEGSWYADATLALIQRLIADKRIHIDAERVYYSGFSYGGKATWEFLRAGRTVFAGAMCGAGWPIGRAYSNPNAAQLKRLRLEIARHKHIPVWIFSGQKDPMRFGSRAVFKELQTIGAKARYLELRDTTHVQSAAGAWANRKHVSWLFAQSRKRNPPAGKDPYPGGVYPND